MIMGTIVILIIIRTIITTITDNNKPGKSYEALLSVGNYHQFISLLMSRTLFPYLNCRRSNRERNPNHDVENKQRKRRDFEFKRLSE